MAVEEVCRLCLTADDLVWIFDKRFESSNNMKDVVFITTGVEITTKDIISQKICKKCCQVTIKMFEFRRTSLKNDQDLRERCKLILKDKEFKIPNTQVTIRSEGKRNNIHESVSDTKQVASEVKPEAKPLYKIHPSVRELFKIYPQIKLPTVCLKYNISPCVAMTMNQVEGYFKSRKIDFQTHSKLALRAGNVATKKTSPLLKTKNLGASKMTKNEQKDKLTKCDVKTNLASSVEKVSTKITNKDKIHSENRDPKEDNKGLNTSHSEAKTIMDGKISSRKRKISDNSASDNREFKKSNFIESLGLTEKMDVDNPVVPSFITNKTQPVHICEICNSVQYSAKDLRKHQNKHLRCQFCKLKFRSLDSKSEHLDTSCSIKNMMNNLPEVKLERVNLNEAIRNRYPEAFQDFPPIINSSLIKRDMDCDVVNLEENQSVHKEAAVLETSEVIEILSDDEDSLPLLPPTNVNTQILPVTQTAGSIVQPSEENIVYSTVSIVRPDIKIKGSNALDLVDARLTDIKVLKELLTVYRPVQLFVGKNVQTDVPVNETILINHKDMSAELKELKPHLQVYKIPVVMKVGNFGVFYNYISEQKLPKKLSLWNDLTPIDIKTPTKPMPNPTLNITINQNGAIVLPSTATYNSTGLINRQTQSVTPTTSKFIRVNANSLSPITTAMYSAPSSNIIDTNPMLNSFLQNTASSTTPTTSIQGAQTTTSLVLPMAMPLVSQATPLVAQTVTSPATEIMSPLVAPTVTTPITQMTTPQTTEITTLQDTQTTPQVVDTTTAPLDTQTSATPSVVTSTQTSSTDPGKPFGIIRVKNVWELT